MFRKVLILSIGLLGPLFWILYGDSYLDLDYQSVLNHFLGADALGKWFSTDW